MCIRLLLETPGLEFRMRLGIPPGFSPVIPATIRSANPASSPSVSLISPWRQVFSGQQPIIPMINASLIDISFAEHVSGLVFQGNVIAEALTSSLRTLPVPPAAA